jgi:hypothetical protein
MRSITILPADGRQAVKDSRSFELKSNSRFKIISAAIHTLSVYTYKVFRGTGNGCIAKHPTIKKKIITRPDIIKEDNGLANISNSQVVEIDIAIRWENLLPVQVSLQMLFQQQRSG